MTAKENYTPGIAEVARSTRGTERIWLGNHEAFRVLSTHGPRRMSKAERRANMYRLAACWNACAGIPTEQIEAKHMKKSTEWQPVETAPRNGKPVLLFTTCHGVVEAWFSRGEQVWTPEGTEHDGPMWICADDVFQIEVEHVGPKEFWHGTATHWMPLPEPPTKRD